jgi:2-keto-4-pentenoate hydratase/2-oxohepta-3-ene-1,7-dioic acid hydratase in catechol pathway
MKLPDYPTLFARFSSSLVAHEVPIIRPSESERLDYEGELVAVIGKTGRRIAKADALEHVAGYSIFNDASIRDFQLRTPQWTMGKNFDGTGAFGPVIVTADELPAGASGLEIETRLNGQVMQRASTDDLIFDVATLVSLISVGITLEPLDLIVTGTPSGVGAVRNPPVFMKAGDVCEVEIERIGVLRNKIADDSSSGRANAA